MTLENYLRQLGKNVKNARKKRGLKQVDVGECGYRHYQNIEAGKVNVTVGTLFRLARVFKVRIEDLVRDSSSEAKPPRKK